MAEPLTDDQLRKLISLSRKASAKPWLAQDEEEKPGMCFVMCQDYWLAESIEPNDAAYIVAACNAGEALADEVLRLRAALERYKSLPIQPVEFIHRNGLGFIEGCVVKYVTRWRAKGGIDDLKKARHFLDMLIAMEGVQRDE